MKKCLYLIMTLSLLACARGPETVIIEFRLAEMESGEGLTEITFNRTGEKFYLHDEVLISNADIASASMTMWQGSPVIDLSFTSAGREKLARLTEENVGKHIGMLVDGKMVSAPLIQAPILEGRAIIDGNFSEKEAQRVAKGIVAGRQ